MQALHIEPEGAYHRALTDAIADARLYMALWDKLLRELPIDLLQEIATLTRNLPWRGRLPFEAALKVRDGERLSKEDVVAKAFSMPDSARQPLRPAAQITPLDQKQAADLIQRALPDGSAQPGQVEMLRAVTDGFNNNKRLMLEASTGHALSYLLPAAWWALHNGERVVISTGSESLRRRLYEQEIPALQTALGDQPLRATLLRRRSDYLCPSRLNIMRRSSPGNIEELRLLAKALIWLGQGGDPHSLAADRLSIRGPGEHIAWARLSAQGCTKTRCETQMKGVCPLYKDQQAAADSHLVLVDHGMLVADALNVEPVIPDYRRVILDEAYALEDTITEGLHTRLDVSSIKRQIADLGTLTHGLLNDILTETKPILPEKTFEQLTAGIAGVAEAGVQMGYHVDNLFKSIMSFLETVVNTHPTEFAAQVRLTEDLRNKPAFGQVRASWGILGQFTETLTAVLPQLTKRLRTFQDKYAVPGMGELIARLENVARDIGGTHTWLTDCITGPTANTVYWAEISAEPDRVDKLMLHAAPLQTGTLLQKHVWQRCQTAIIAGAALRTGSTFHYLQDRLGASDFDVVTNGENSDTERSILVYLPTDMPEPSDRERYQRLVERGIIELATATQGRLLALFTSFTQLRQASQHITARLALGNITVLDQSDGTSMSTLLEGFRQSERVVLLGVRGFWDDVELSEDDLAALVIVRLPFAVPSDPIFAARSETFDDPLNQYTVPGAILRFRQSFERLVLARRHRGVVAVFDRRMTTKEYGQAFLDSLPPCTIRRAPIADLPGAAQEWLSDKPAE
jgi:DNA polymerase-3 subunit epsilon/ATP-dependent DNA helicase DinG